MDIKKLDKNMAIAGADKGLSWYDAGTLTVEGKGWLDTDEFYDRFPAKAKGVVRDEVWALSRHASGISVHFTSNTSYLAVQWDGFRAMEHMPATGVSGLDLYVRHNGEWRWLAAGRPHKEMNEAELFKNASPAERDYMLYLPLYNPVHVVRLGVPEGCELKPTPPRKQKPVVFYGTSITQGGCASRPGMSYTAIIGRMLDRPVINLGFSGNGIMEPEVIDLLCELDPSVYVLDNLPNMTPDRINKVEEEAVRKLRGARPHVPIVLVDNILYCNAYLLGHVMERYLAKNKAQYAVYEKLVSEGMHDLYYVKDDALIGSDGEATVDGVHFTDLGYMRFAQALAGVLRKLPGG